jgi:hypothetical protein
LWYNYNQLNQKGIQVGLKFTNIRETSRAFSKAKTIPSDFQGLSAEEKAQVLTQTNDKDNKGYNALMMALMSYKPATVPILNAMEQLELQQQATILTQVSHYDNWNPLMIATRFYTDAVVPILNAMLRLQPHQQEMILTQVTNAKQNILMMAAGFNPDAIVPILKAIHLSKMDVQKKYLLLKNALKNNPENDAIKIAFTQLNWEKEVRDLLNQIKLDEPKDKRSVVNPDLPQMVLFNSLTRDLDTYLNSSKSPKDLKVFHAAWNNTITEARQNKSLAANGSVMEILKTLLLIVSVVGMIYLAYKAGQNNAKNRSLFFPGTLEKKINTLQDKQLEAIATKGAEGDGNNVSAYNTPCPSAPHIDSNNDSAYNKTLHDRPPAYNPSAPNDDNEPPTYVTPSN